MELALIESEQSYRTVVENVNEVIFQTDVTGLWLFLNKSWEEVTGFTVDESLGQLFLNFIHPEDRQRNIELFEPLISREKDYCRHEIRYLNKNGGFRWVEVFPRIGENEQHEQNLYVCREIRLQRQNLFFSLPGKDNEEGHQDHADGGVRHIHDGRAIPGKLFLIKG